MQHVHKYSYVDGRRKTRNAAGDCRIIDLVALSSPIPFHFRSLGPAATAFVKLLVPLFPSLLCRAAWIPDPPEAKLMPWQFINDHDARERKIEIREGEGERERVRNSFVTSVGQVSSEVTKIQHKDISIYPRNGFFTLDVYIECRSMQRAKDLNLYYSTSRIMSCPPVCLSSRNESIYIGRRAMWFGSCLSLRDTTHRRLV